jgi:hypothetical protein
MCHFWLHTAFLSGGEMTLPVREIDGAFKKINKHFDADFKITVHYEVVEACEGDGIVASESVDAEAS